MDELTKKKYYKSSTEVLRGAINGTKEEEGNDQEFINEAPSSFLINLL